MASCYHTQTLARYSNTTHISTTHAHTRSHGGLLILPHPPSPLPSPPRSTYTHDSKLLSPTKTDTLYAPGINPRSNFKRHPLSLPGMRWLSEFCNVLWLSVGAMPRRRCWRLSLPRSRTVSVASAFHPYLDREDGEGEMGESSHML